MSFFDHLDELRKRLIWIAITVVICAAISWVFVGDILQLLQDPLPPKVELYFGTPMAAFMAKIKLSLYSGVILALPMILFQVLSFLVPALSKKERRIAYMVLASGGILALTGIVSGYIYIFPIGINWLVLQGLDVGINPILMIDTYVSFAALFLMGLGIAAETPLILLAAIRFGLVTREQLKKNWRIVYIVILLAAAIITPDWSPVTMAAVAVPMAVLYHGTLLLAYLIRKKDPQV